MFVMTLVYLANIMKLRIREHPSRGSSHHQSGRQWRSGTEIHIRQDTCAEGSWEIDKNRPKME